MNSPTPVSTLRRRATVVTDSACALPAALAGSAGILIASMEVTIGGSTYVDGPDGSISDFYSQLRGSVDLPTTSAPRPAAWLEVFKRASRDAESILCITLSASLSASFDSARVAADMAQEELPDARILIFDSKAAAGSQALIALEAARHAANNHDLEAIHAAAANVAQRVRLVAFLDTLEYIWRGGRVPRAAVWVSNLLDIKPVMELTPTRIGPLARPRSRKAALARLLEEVRRDATGKRLHANVTHADAEAEALLLMEKIRGEFDCAELLLTPFHPFMGAHTGPGLAGVAYWVE